MEEAMQTYQYLIRKFINWAFNDAVIINEPRVTIGYLLSAIVLIGVIIGTLAPKVAGGADTLTRNITERRGKAK